MPGALFFPPTEVKISASKDNTVEYYRALAAVVPFGIMTVLVLVCLICAECFGKRKRKVKEHESPALRTRPGPSRPIPFLSPDSNSRDDLLKTPSESDAFEGPHSFDFLKASFGYGNNSMVGDDRSDLEGTFKASEESPAQTTTPPFARLRPTPPRLFRKEEDDLPDESRSPSPKTLIHQGKMMRHGAWIHTPSTTSSATSDTSQSTMFQMSISDDEAKRAKEEEKKAKERKKLLREKRRLKREMREDQAAIIRQQINWSAKDEYDEMMRESRAMDIPPRERVEEHPEYQRMVIAMFDEVNAEFDETTALNSVWEKGRMEEFLKKNLGYLPEQVGAVGGEPAEDFSTLREAVKEEPEDTTEEPDDTLPLLPKHESSLPETGAKGKAAEDLSQHHGARRKIPLETGARGKSAENLSQHHGSRRKIPLETGTKGEASQHHGARKKIPLETGGKSKAAEDLSQYYVRKVVPVTEAEGSQPQFQHHGARRKVHEEPVVKTKKSKAAAKYSQPLLLQHDARRKKFPETEASGDTSQPLIRHHLPVKRVVGVKGEASQPLLHHHGAGRKVLEAQAVGGKKASVDNFQPLFHHYGAGKNYGTMLPEVHPIGVFTTEMLDSRVPLVIGKEYEEKRISETRKVSSKIAKAVFNIEMKRIEDQMVLSHLKTREKDSEKHDVEIHQEPSSSGLIRKRQSPVVDESEHVVEIPQEPSSSGLMRRKLSTVIEEDTVVELGAEDTSSSWEDIAPEKKYVWWPGIGDRKKGAKKKKLGKR